jgi:hypothetical protein
MRLQKRKPLNPFIANTDPSSVTAWLPPHFFKLHNQLIHLQDGTDIISSNHGHGVLITSEMRRIVQNPGRNKGALMLQKCVFEGNFVEEPNCAVKEERLADGVWPVEALETVKGEKGRLFCRGTW